MAVAVVAQSIGTTTKGHIATLELQLRHLEEVPGGASLPDAAGRVAELCAALDGARGELAAGWRWSST